MNRRDFMRGAGGVAAAAVLPVLAVPAAATAIDGVVPQMVTMPLKLPPFVMARSDFELYVARYLIHHDISDLLHREGEFFDELKRAECDLGLQHLRVTYVGQTKGRLPFIEIAWEWEGQPRRLMEIDPNLRSADNGD